MSKQQPQK